VEIGIGTLVFVGIPLLVVLVFAALGLRRMHHRNEAIRRESASPAVGVLRYHVPEGQDPAAVLAALETEGYAATLSPGPATHDVMIPCRSGADRERAHVRAVIAHAALNMEGDPGDHPVVFADEPGGTSGSGRI
jgi:hypothetical protein